MSTRAVSGPPVAVRSVLDDASVTIGPGRARQEEIYRDGVSGRRPRVPTAPVERERRGRRAMSRAADAYVSGGAGAEPTMRADREAFGRFEIVPRVLRGSSGRDLSVDLFGRRPTRRRRGPLGRQPERG